MLGLEWVPVLGGGAGGLMLDLWTLRNFLPKIHWEEAPRKSPCPGQWKTWGGGGVFRPDFPSKPSQAILAKNGPKGSFGQNCSWGLGPGLSGGGGVGV